MAKKSDTFISGYALAQDLDQAIISLNDHQYEGRYVVVRDLAVDQGDLRVTSKFEFFSKIIDDDLKDKARLHNISKCKLSMYMDVASLHLHVKISFYFSPEEEFIYNLTT